MPRFYLLHGLDEFAIAGFVDDLKRQMGDPSTATLNTTLLDGRSVNLSQVQAVCGALPFLAEHRLVIVEGWLTRLLSRGEGEAEEAEPARGGAAAKEAQAALAAYLEEQPDTAWMVLVEKRELPEKNPVLKAAAGRPWAVVRKFDLPTGEALLKWVQARAKAEGGGFTREAAQALAEAEGDPRALGQEIAKLITYVGQQRPVEVGDVHALTPAGGEARIFNFVDHLGQRQGRLALRELHQLLEREEPLYVLGMITRQYRLLLQAKELLDGRATEEDVAQALRLHPYPAGKVCAQTRSYNLAALERIYHRLLECDVDIKTGRAEPAAALDTLVAELTL
jgi:DNA polymerase-3 subunit delta